MKNTKIKKATKPLTLKEMKKIVGGGETQRWQIMSELQTK